MAKARIVTSDGTEVNVDGTPSEIAAVLKELKIARATERATKVHSSKARRSEPGKVTVPGLLDDLIQDKFFTKPKGMGDVRGRLADLGHHYPLTSLSGPLQSHVRSRRLRRFKKDGKYVYAQ